MLWGISNSPKNSKSSWHHRSFSQRHTLPSFFLIVLGVAFVVVFRLFCFVRLFVYFKLELSDTIAASIFNMKVKVSFHNFFFLIIRCLFEYFCGDEINSKYVKHNRFA